MDVGIIGTGNMGTMLAETFITSGAVPEEKLCLTNRDLQKAEAIRYQYTSVNVMPNATRVARRCRLIFVCVRPAQFPTILDAIQSCIDSEDIVVSITSPVTLAQLESVVPCKVVRAVPSITNRSHTGASLITYGDGWSPQAQAWFEDWMSQFSVPQIVSEETIRVSSDIVSCGPAFFGYLLEEMTTSAVRKTDLTKEQAERLAEEMMIGLGRLFSERLYSLETLQEKVKVPGGVTGVGIEVLKQTEGVFDELFTATHEKFAEDQKMLRKAFADRLK
ncbi:late competence protein ComER [Natribacillus halophilus]|uniref:Competence protein ComER n=1 Tax=Natribacillus halophilus TaxID=549003 RepID=A0A1G8JU45_9BACI|nr:late competence protein ComER [Natribacillus halophilus]SDI34708.1 competence protein ComER [Natribacillus halophilus]